MFERQDTGAQKESRRQKDWLGKAASPEERSESEKDGLFREEERWPREERPFDVLQAALGNRALLRRASGLRSLPWLNGSYDFAAAQATLGNQALARRFTRPQSPSEAIPDMQGSNTNASALQATASRGTSGSPVPLPHRKRIQESFGSHDVGTVEAFVGGPAHRASEAMGAEAYAYGNKVAFREAPDLKTAAHEAAHVVQQRGGMRLLGGVGREGDAYERNAEEVTNRVLAGRYAADLLPEPSASSAPFTVQRWITVAGAPQDEGKVEKILMGRLLEPDRFGLAVHMVVSKLGEQGRWYHFADFDALAANVHQRVLTSFYMWISQGGGGMPAGPQGTRKAFGFPNNPLENTERVGPKVNDAAVDYWSGPTGDPYYWILSSMGRKNPYGAIKALFQEQVEPSKRSLMHCDYVISVIRMREYAETIGVEKFNQQVLSGVLPLALCRDMFDVMANFPRGGPPLMLHCVQSEQDLVIGDHVIFRNHHAYDLLNEGIHGAWRLENAIVVNHRNNKPLYQGHGFPAPVNREDIIGRMLNAYNDLVKCALAITSRIEHGDESDRAASQAKLGTRFPNVYRRSDGRWEIRDHEGSAVQPLTELTAEELPSLVDPSTQRIEVWRPVEAKL